MAVANNKGGRHYPTIYDLLSAEGLLRLFHLAKFAYVVSHWKKLEPKKERELEEALLHMCACIPYIFHECYCSTLIKRRGALRKKETGLLPATGASGRRRGT